MIITVASYKGGVGKTTTAVHLAAYLNTLAPTILFDGDVTRNATAWSQRGPSEGSRKAGFGFRVAPFEAAAKLAREFAHVVIDTGQRPSSGELQAAAESCDLLVIPAVPSSLDTDGLGQTVQALQHMRADNFRVLLTRVPAYAGREAGELREVLASIEAPAFATEIPRLTAFEKAAGAGQIVSDADDRQAGRAWAAYVAAGKELA